MYTSILRRWVAKRSKKVKLKFRALRRTTSPRLLQVANRVWLWLSDPIIPRVWWLVLILLIFFLLLFGFRRPVYPLMDSLFQAPPPALAEESSELESAIFYSFGQYQGCAGYVATRVLIPNGFGMAREWDNSAREMGWRVDRVPEVGSIAHNEYGRDGRGHVSLVEKVDGNRIYVSEKGWGAYPYQVNYRWTDISDWSWFLHP